MVSAVYLARFTTSRMGTCAVLSTYDPARDSDADWLTVLVLSQPLVPLMWALPLTWSR